MPEEKKVAIREELTKRYFGKEVAAHENESPINLKEMKEVAIEAIKAIRK